MARNRSKARWSAKEKKAGGRATETRAPSTVGSPVTGGRTKKKASKASKPQNVSATEGASAEEKRVIGSTKGEDKVSKGRSFDDVGAAGVAMTDAHGLPLQRQHLDVDKGIKNPDQEISVSVPTGEDKVEVKQKSEVDDKYTGHDYTAVVRRPQAERISISRREHIGDQFRAAEEQKDRNEAAEEAASMLGGPRDNFLCPGCNLLTPHHLNSGVKGPDGLHRCVDCA